MKNRYSTSNKTEYSKKLLDPRWQKKRLQILNRDKFTCRVCGDKETTLHIHHEKYERGKEPWDYPNSNLYTLCADCHSFIEYEKRNIGEAPVTIYTAYKFFIDGDMVYVLSDANNLRIIFYGENKEMISDNQFDTPHLLAIKKIINTCLKVELKLSNG